MKTLKFDPHLVKIVEAGVKDTTWRINDDKEIFPGDIFTFIKRPELIEFAKAEILWVKETMFKNLTEEDRAGHEKFENDMEMYEYYSKCYGFEVKPETCLKVVKFKLLDQ